MKAGGRSAGVLLTGVCLGIALGARLSGVCCGPARGQEPATARLEPAAMRPPPPPAVPQPAPPSDSAPALEGSWIPQGRYTPLVGPAPAVAQGEPDAGGSFLGSDTLAGAPTSSPSPLPATPDVVGVGRDSVHGGDVVAPAAVVPPPAHVRAPVDHPGPIDALANGQGMALVLGRPGGRVVLFEALEDGDRSLPSDVTGRWAVVRGCRRFRIDLSQRRGPAGALRGVGRGITRRWWESRSRRTGVNVYEGV
jgi:hypothetical protein